MGEPFVLFAEDIFHEAKAAKYLPEVASKAPELIQGPGVLPNWGGKQVVKREGGW